MKKFPFLCFLMLAGCADAPKEQFSQSLPTDDPPPTEFIVSLDRSDHLHYEKMRILPILGTTEHIEAHADLTRLVNLKEAMETHGFRITEKKPYGRFDDREAVNLLTVQNKTNETIFLMAGDVVQGGNQDRVLAQDLIVPPRSIRDIDVFCVEPNRWSYRSTTPEELEDEFDKKNRKVFAFTGYYNVVSNDIRKSVKHQKSQELVWEKVGQITATNNATTSTGTYAALEDAPAFTTERNQYLAYFADKFDHMENVIGMVVITGDRVLGTDIFNHPKLFKKQYPALLHSYVTDAVTHGSTVRVKDEALQRYVDQLMVKYHYDLGARDAEAKFRYNDRIVHFTDFEF